MFVYYTGDIKSENFTSAKRHDLFTRYIHTFVWNRPRTYVNTLTLAINDLDELNLKLAQSSEPNKATSIL